MSFLSRIKGWLRPQPTQIQPKRRAHPTTPAQNAAPQPEPTPVQAAPPLPPATGVADSRVRVQVLYRDASTHETLHAAITLSGHPGEPLPITWQVIPGFVLTAIIGFTQVFPNASQVLLCEYSARVAGPVMVYHRDLAGHLLQVPEMLSGVVNESFTATALPEFAKQVVGSPKQSGMFSATSQRLRFTYNLSPLEAGKKPADTYIQLLAAKLVYSAPLAGAPLRQALPQGTFWRVYALMRDTNTNTVWLNVGGAQWLTADDTRGQDANPFLPDPTPLSLPHRLFTLNEEAVSLQGVAYADATLWQEPYGKMLPQRLLEGTAVTIVARAILSNHATWYRLHSGEYVLASLIQVAHPRRSGWGGVRQH